MCFLPAVKRLIGKDFEDVQQESGRLAYTVSADEDGFAVVDCPNLEAGAGRWAAGLAVGLVVQGHTLVVQGRTPELWLLQCCWMCIPAGCNLLPHHLRHCCSPLVLPAGGQLYPEEVSGYVVGKLLAAAEEFAGRPVGKAVVSVPAYFTDGQVG